MVWLIRTWSGLKDMIKITDKWTDDQIRLAMNLAGFRPELREGYHQEIADSTTEELIELVDGELGRLAEGPGTVARQHWTGLTA